MSWANVLCFRTTGSRFVPTIVDSIGFPIETKATIRISGQIPIAATAALRIIPIPLTILRADQMVSYHNRSNFDLKQSMYLGIDFRFGDSDHCSKIRMNQSRYCDPYLVHFCHAGKLPKRFSITVKLP